MTQAAEGVDALEEIVVTARKREENVLQVPDAVSVFSADKIDSAGIKNVTDLANLVPNMFFTPTYRPSEMQMTLRGIPTAQGGEAPVAVVIDGVQVSHPTFINQELLDIQQIEVLRGPQGSLYGRNAIGGAINITTRQPTNDFDGMVRASYASGNDIKVSGAISGPIVNDTLLFRISGIVRDYRGQITDQTARDGDRKADFDSSHLVKAALLLNASANLTFDLRGNLLREHAGAPTIEIVDRAHFDDFSRSFLNRNVLTSDRRRIDDVSLKITYQFAKAQLTSVSGYSKSVGNLFGDADFTPAPILLQEVDLSVKALTQELRLASTGDTSLRWLAGLYYQNRDTDNFLQIPNGVGGVEYRLLLLFDRGVQAGRISLEQLVAITSTNPAKLFGLYPRKGSLMVGSDADVVVLDPSGETRLSVSTSPSQVDYSIYEGWTVAGAIRSVLSRGKVVVVDGVVDDCRGHGRFVERGPTLAKP